LSFDYPVVNGCLFVACLVLFAWRLCIAALLCLAQLRERSGVFQLELKCIELPIAEVAFRSGRTVPS